MKSLVAILLFAAGWSVPAFASALKTSHEIAEETGKLADAHLWPAFGQKPRKFPFFVSVSLDKALDDSLIAREQKTLDYLNFTSSEHRRVSGAWFMENRSYCQLDIEKMQTRMREAAAAFKKEGGKVEDIVYSELTDEPTGQPLERIVNDTAYRDHFRAWLRRLGETPESLLVNDWDAVKLVTEAQRDQFPALYYFSQCFRTQALGDFMATQRKLIEQEFGGKFPVLANFSDGAICNANFFSQGVDYFQMLDSTDQNAIWGEDWSNGASTYQCASFNVDLMRAAARRHPRLASHPGARRWHRPPDRMRYAAG